jgi:hypothetical protein
MVYEPIGDELDGPAALMQAAMTIDAAVFLAVESKNVEKLMDAAAMWMGLAERLGIDAEEDEDSEDEVENGKVFGFCAASQVNEPTKEVTTENERTDTEE